MIRVCVVAGESLAPFEVFDSKLRTLGLYGLFSSDTSIISSVSVQLALIPEPNGPQWRSFIDSPLLLFLVHGLCLHR